MTCLPASTDLMDHSQCNVLGARCRRRRHLGPRAAPRTSRTRARSPTLRVLLRALPGRGSRRRRARPSRRRAPRDHLPVDIRGRDDAEVALPHDVSVIGSQGGLEDAVAARAREAEEDDVCDVLGGHHPREHVGRAAVALLEREVRRDAAGADVRAADAVLAQLVVERAREPDLAELRRAVDGFARETAAAGLGRDRDDDRPRRSRSGAGWHARSGVDRPLQVDVDHLLDVLERGVDERVVRADAGVRDADVEPAEALDRLAPPPPRPGRGRERRR